MEARRILILKGAIKKKPSEGNERKKGVVTIRLLLPNKRGEGGQV